MQKNHDTDEKKALLMQRLFFRPVEDKSTKFGKLVTRFSHHIVLFKIVCYFVKKCKKTVFFVARGVLCYLQKSIKAFIGMKSLTEF